MKIKRQAIRFDRNEFAGALGDLGLAVPLITAMIITNNLDAASVLIMFGVFHIITGFVLGLPIPVQPLKAMAAIMLTLKPAKEVLFGAGLVVGIFFTILAFTNLTDKLDKIPRSVIRGIQFGLGISLIMTALGYMQKDAYLGWILSFIGVLITFAFYNSRRIPPALILIAIGVLVSFVLGVPMNLISSVGFSSPKFFTPSFNDILLGALILAIPQIPLSLGNSIIATSSLTKDLFPSKQVSTRKLSLTVGLMNLVSPFFSGIPVCHGAGGLAGHFRFGGRTGGAVVIIGTFFVVIGLFFSHAFEEILGIFPLALLGVLLLFTGLDLALLVRETTTKKEEFFISLLVGSSIIGLPYGYLIGIVGGCILSYLFNKGKIQI